MNPLKRICGLYVDEEEVLLSLATEDGGRVEQAVGFQPFCFSSEPISEVYEALRNEGELRCLNIFQSAEHYQAAMREREKHILVEACHGLTSQFLLERKSRLYTGLNWEDMRRMQVDIETASQGGQFSDAKKKEDRVLAIGIRQGDREVILELESFDDAAEKTLLEAFNNILQEWDPDIIEGHNIFNFDLQYLKERYRRLKVKITWGRFGKTVSFRNSRLKIAERWQDYLRCDIPGRTVVDTLFLVQLYDISQRSMKGYGLKPAALHFGISLAEERTYIEGSEIQNMFVEDRARFREYLRDDLRECGELANLLLPTYFAQASSFPMDLQDIYIRGTAAKVDLIFLEEYFAQRASLPALQEVQAYQGGYTESFELGIFEHVLHFDVASLYPSLMLVINRNPRTDSLGVMIPKLKELRAYRLQYKQLAQKEENPTLKQEYNARQASYKILINSIYGYLGFGAARFSDPELAAEITARGRDILISLIKKFQELSVLVLEADTDGIYVSSEAYARQPADLLEKVSVVLPEGIQLEFDGHYEKMFCYKSKNYALYDGKNVIVKGAALKSRGLEPFLRQLNDSLIEGLLGAADVDIHATMAQLESDLSAQKLPVEEVAKSEFLSKSPSRYAKDIEAGKGPRRASLEVALQMDPPPKMGDRVTYFIAPKEKGQTADWQRARPVGTFAPGVNPYDPAYYKKKIQAWKKRYIDFL